MMRVIDSRIGEFAFVEYPSGKRMLVSVGVTTMRLLVPRWLLGWVSPKCIARIRLADVLGGSCGQGLEGTLSKEFAIKATLSIAARFSGPAQAGAAITADWINKTIAEVIDKA